MFITLEGIEGCGKTTQAKLLADYLSSENYNVLLTREPGGPYISEKIRKLLLDQDNNSMFPETELLLYLASRSQHTGEWIIPALKKNKIVVCDRYTDSTIAYQGGGRQIAMNALLELTRFASYEVKPELTFLIDISVELSLKRIAHKKTDRLEKESVAFHQRVRKMFLNVANSDKNRYFIINGDDKIETIHEIIKGILSKKIKDGFNEDYKDE